MTRDPRLEELAKAAYYKMADNDPIIHSNRFPTWEELSAKEKTKWRNKVKEQNQ